MKAFLLITNVGQCNNAKPQGNFKSCLFTLYNHKQQSEREKSLCLPLSAAVYCTLCADTALQLISTMQSSNWNIPGLVQPHSLHQDRLVPVLNLEEEAYCVNTCYGRKLLKYISTKESEILFLSGQGANETAEPAVFYCTTF